MMIMVIMMSMEIFMMMVMRMMMVAILQYQYQETIDHVVMIVGWRIIPFCTMILPVICSCLGSCFFRVG